MFQTTLANNITTCVTKKAVYQATLRWEIQQFRDPAISNRNILQSKILSFKEDSGLKFEVNLYTNGYKNRNKGFMSVYLISRSSDREIYAICTFSVIDSNNDAKHEKIIQCLFDSDNYIFGDGRWIRLNEVEHLLNQDNLHIQCKVEAMVYEPIIDPLESERLYTLKKKALLSEIISLNCDDGRGIKVHKKVLVESSPFFERMLETEMIETINKDFHIKETSFEVLNSVILYAYSKTIPEYGSWYPELLYAADKFLMNDMKLALEEKVIDNIDATNYNEMLRVCEDIHLNRAKKEIIDYIAKNTYT